MAPSHNLCSILLFHKYFIIFYTKMIGNLFNIKGAKLLSSPITTQRNTVVILPCGTARRSGLGVQMSLALKTTVFATGCGKSTKLTVLMYRLADPVDTRIITDSSVSRVNKNHLKILVHSVLIYPVRVKNTQSTTFASNSLFSKTTKISSGLKLCDTLIHRLSIHNTLQSSKQRIAS